MFKPCSKSRFIAISLISFGNGNLHIYRGSRIIRDFMQLATFTTNFRHVLCDLCETRFDSLNDCIPGNRPEQEACTPKHVPIGRKGAPGEIREI